jgi:hypothetical protein
VGRSQDKPPWCNRSDGHRIPQIVPDTILGRWVGGMLNGITPEERTRMDAESERKEQERRDSWNLDKIREKYTSKAQKKKRRRKNGATPSAARPWSRRL